VIVTLCWGSHGTHRSVRGGRSHYRVVHDSGHRLSRGGWISKRCAWIVVIAVFVAAVAVPINQYKVPPVLPLLMETFRLGLTMQGARCPCRHHLTVCM